MTKPFICFIALLLSLMFAVSCSDPYDDSTVWESINELKERVSAMETVTNAYKNKLFITSVKNIDNEYIITFSDGSKATITNGKDGKDGAQGPQGERGTPGKDGRDGKDGAQGPQGEKGNPGKDGETLIENIVIGKNEVTFNLTDGTSLSIPFYSALSIKFDENDLVPVTPNSTRNIHYEIQNASSAIDIEVVSSADIKAKVIKDQGSDYRGIIEVKIGVAIDEYSKVVVFVSDGMKVVMKSISFEEEGLKIADNANKEISGEGGELRLEFLTNVPCEAIIPEEAESWIMPVKTKTKAMEKQVLLFDVKENTGAPRSAEITVRAIDGNLALVYTVQQSGGAEYDKQIDREALIALYNATDGPHWKNNTNWCSDKPLNEWYGVTTNKDGFVTGLDFYRNNNLSGPIPKEFCTLTHIEDLEIDFPGEIPPEIGNLTSLKWLRLTGNMSGSLPPEIGNLKNLEWLQVWATNMSGTIPDELYNCVNLRNLDLGWWTNLRGTISPKIRQLTNLEMLALHHSNLSGTIPKEIYNCRMLTHIAIEKNMLSGTIPAELGDLPKLQYFECYRNDLSGDIPAGILNHRMWKTEWGFIVEGNNFNLDNVPIKAIDFSVTDIDGNPIHSMEEFAKNKYTILLQFDSYFGGVSSAFISGVYEKYIDKGVDVIGYTREQSGNDFNEVTNYLKKQNVPWRNILWTKENSILGSIEAENRRYGSWYSPYYPFHTYPAYTVVDSQGNIVFWDFTNDKDRRLEKFLSEKIDGVVLEDKVKELNEADFRKYVYDYEAHPDEWLFKGDKPAVIDFGATWCGYCQQMFPIMERLANEYKGKVDFYKVDVDKESELFNLMNKSNASIPLFVFIPTAGDPVNKTGARSIEEMRQLIDATITGGQENLYASTDYSHDGKVRRIQAAAVGKGIDIVLMGDGYSDRQIAAGDYDRDMDFAAEKFFTEEPYTTYRNRFNVYSVTAVSKREGIAPFNSTALSGWFGEGTVVGGNDNKCFTYAQKAISSSRMDDALIVVMMNSKNYAGTCYMYYPQQQNDYGSGTSVAWFPTGSDDTMFEQLLHHEAGGHGFAKLADEYSNTQGTIPQSVVDNNYHKWEPAGWWKNIDFTNDPATIKWHTFLSDMRYDGLVGIFEGGATYPHGVWRSTQSSIMVNNTGGFNAPSREAIYYRINKLAYGESWTYDYETFAEYDARNRRQAAAAPQHTAIIPYKDFVPLHPPVVVGKTWREAMNENKPK